MGQSVEYLGHVITKDGVSTDPSVIDAIVKWPIPLNVKQLRGFFWVMWLLQKVH